MRILCVTFEAPSRKSGGGIGILQSLIAATNNGSVDYVGPAFNEGDFPELVFNKTFFFQIETSTIKKIFNFVRGLPVGQYNSWKKYSKILRADDYDVVYIDFSRHDYVLDWAKKNTLPVVIRIHNIEYDYFNRIVKGTGSRKQKLSSYFKREAMRKSERKCMYGADALLFLTEEDKARAYTLYPQLDSKSNEKNIMPVCVDISGLCNYAVGMKKPYVLLTGSLWYGANAYGAMWFLNNVWPTIGAKNPEWSLVVAGARPNDDIQKLCMEASHCTLVDTPDDMSPYFNEASIYVAPVFDGAGMKVKVAEALGWGLPVVSTSHALIGYEGVDSVCIQADSKEEFIVAVQKYIDDLPTKQSIRNVFEKKYGIPVCINIVRECLRGLLIDE